MMTLYRKWPSFIHLNFNLFEKVIHKKNIISLKETIVLLITIISETINCPAKFGIVTGVVLLSYFPPLHQKSRHA